MMIDEFKRRVLEDFYQKHPQGKQLLDIDIGSIVEKFEDKIDLLEDEIRNKENDEIE